MCLLMFVIFGRPFHRASFARYKLCGYLLPRNADDIFRKTSNTTNLQPGDLLFFALPSTQHIFHVMMVATNTTIMESSFDTRMWESPLYFASQPNILHATAGPGVIANNGTRIVSAMEKFGVPLNTLQWGQKLPHYFDRYYPFIISHLLFKLSCFCAV